MSYTEVFNGEYDHKPLFKVNATVWIAVWCAATRVYTAYKVVVCNIFINSVNDVVYTVETGRAGEEALEYHSEDIFADRATALEAAKVKLLYELSAELAELKKEMDKKHTDYANAQMRHYRLEQQIRELEIDAATKGA